LEPKVEDRLRPEEVLLRPPSRNPVVARQHLARDLTVMRFPRIAEGVAAEERQVQHEVQQQQPEAEATQQRSLTIYGTELDQHAERRHHRPGHARRDEHAGNQRSTRHAPRYDQTQPRDQDEQAAQKLESARQERAPVHGRARYPVVERPEPVEHAQRAHEKEGRTDRHRQRKVQVGAHHEERHERCCERTGEAPWPHAIARRNQRVAGARLRFRFACDGWSLERGRASGQLKVGVGHCE
jgi:hypothetical protein